MDHAVSQQVSPDAAASPVISAALHWLASYAQSC